MEKRQWAILGNWKKILKERYNLKDESGIYLFYRTNENNEKCVYVGQSIKILTRCAGHLATRKKESHIDKSLEKHGLWSNNNQNGWFVSCIKNCSINELDYYEKRFISHYLTGKYKVYNITGGGQLEKETDINERQKIKLKTYANGKKFAYKQIQEKLKTLFEKYLDVTIKGKETKIKQKKLEEFKQFIGEKEDE